MYKKDVCLTYIHVIQFNSAHNDSDVGHINTNTYAIFTIFLPIVLHMEQKINFHTAHF